MKYSLPFLLVFFVVTASAQDALKIDSINRIVTSINSASFRISKDSILQDLPEYGLKMNTYVTAFMDGKNLKKYVNYAVTVTKKDSLVTELTTSSSFYFDENKLIKVEEFARQGGKEQTMDWYFDGDKPIFWTSTREDASSRAELLLKIAKAVLGKISNGN